jgi:hypothetical protein
MVIFNLWYYFFMQAPTPGALNIHKKSIHELIKHPCDQCEHRATTPASLKLHIKAVVRIHIKH